MSPEVIDQFLTKFVFPVLEAVVLIGVNVLIAFIARKYRLEGMAQYQDKIDKVVLDGIAYAEEHGKAFIKSYGNNPGRGKITGGDKLNLALSYVANNLPALSREDVIQKIHSKLAQTPGVGATGEIAVR